MEDEKLENYSNLIFIQNNFFNRSKLKTKILGRNIYKIEGINFTIFFLVKSFISWNELKSVKVKNLLIANILPILSNDIFIVWSKVIHFVPKNPKVIIFYYILKQKNLLSQNILQIIILI